MSNKGSWFKNIDELMVLACLSQKPCYCSEVVEFINSYRDEEHKINHSAVFNALYFLQDKKAIEEQGTRVTEGKKRVYYNILPAGRKYFEKFLKDYHDHIRSLEKVVEDSAWLKNLDNLKV